MKNTLIIMSMLWSFTFSAQSNFQYCKFEVDNTYKDEIEKALTSSSSSHDLGLTSVPVALTFLMKSDSTSSFYEGLEQEIMDSIYSHFLPSGIHMYLADAPTFIYEDLVFDFVIGDNEELLYPGIKNNRINVVVANSISSSGGASYCGIAQIFPNTIFARYSCIPSNTISHEIGHELGLAHTHHTSYGVELVDGSNCDTAGDLICDTPADPNRADLITNECEWEGTYEDEYGYDIHLEDSNGDRYDPDISNLMSYYGVHGCRNDFTFQQSVVMQEKLTQKLLNYGYETKKMTFEIYNREDLCQDGYKISARVKNPAANVDYTWDLNSDGVVDQSGLDVQFTYTDYGDYTVKLIMTYPDGREFYQSQVCVIQYSNESIDAPFVDDFNEEIDRYYVSLQEESLYKWNLKLHLTNGRIVAGDQIHINENSVMEYRVNLSNLDEAILEFEYDCNEKTAIGGDTLLVELLTCDDTFILFEEWGQSLGTNGEFRNVSIPMPSTDSEVVSIRFTTKGDDEQWHDMYIDNLRVYENNVSNVFNALGKKLKLFPNPTNSIIEVQLDGIIDNLYLVDMYGKMFDIKYSDSIIDLSSLPNGVYIIHAFAGGNRYQQKVLKVE